MLHERNNFVNRTFKYLFEKSWRRGRAARAANRVPEFRRRILNGEIVEYARCRTSHTVALEDETYCYCTLESAMPFAEYLPYAKREQERAKAARSIEEDAADTGDLLFISTLPWLSYTALVQPVPVPADSNPRINLGQVLHGGGENAAARFRAVQPCAGGRLAHRGVLPAARGGDGGAVRAAVRRGGPVGIVLHFFCDLFTFWHCFFAALCIII